MRPSLSSPPPPVEPSDPSPANARVIIIEDYRSTAEMLHLLCTEHWGLTVAAMESSCTGGLRAVASIQPDLALLDIGLPDGDGLSLISKIQEASPKTKVILLSSLFNNCVLQRLKDVGWCGLHDKVSDGLCALWDAIDVVLNGGRYISPSVRQLIACHQQSHNPFSRMLSVRENEVLACIAHALTNEEIALHLKIDASTALSHRKSLFKKLGQNSTPKLMHYAIRHGYASLPVALFCGVKAS